MSRGPCRSCWRGWTGRAGHDGQRRADANAPTGRAHSLRKGSTFGHLTGMCPPWIRPYRFGTSLPRPSGCQPMFCLDPAVNPSCKSSGAPVARMSLAVAVASARGWGMRAPARSHTSSRTARIPRLTPFSPPRLTRAPRDAYVGRLTCPRCKTPKKPNPAQPLPRPSRATPPAAVHGH